MESEIMKTPNRDTLLALAVCGTTLLLSACSKKEEPAAPTASEAQKPMNAIARDAQKAATSTADEAQKQAAEAKAAAETAAAAAQKQTEAAAAPAQTQVQGLIDRIKGLVADQKYTEALSSLNELSKLKLTAEQQTWMDEVKAQIQKAMASKATSDATKSVGGLLDKKK